MTAEQYKLIMEWQNRTFPKSTAESKIHHLLDEVTELHEAIVLNHIDTKMEVADCLFLLYGVANKLGMTYDDVTKCLDAKFEINKARNWGTPDNNGVVNHVKHEASA